MTWIAVPNDFWHNPRCIPLSNGSVGLLFRLVGYSSVYGTDGFLEAPAVDLMQQRQAADESGEQLTALVNAGVLHVAGDPCPTCPVGDFAPLDRFLIHGFQEFLAT